MAKKIKFYEDKEKTKQIYPELDPHGVYPGVTVGLADNLVSNEGQTISGEMQFRTVADTESIGSGFAKLLNIKGTSESTTIEEASRYDIYGDGISQIDFNLNTFKEQITETGTYNFIYTPIVNANSSLIKEINTYKFAKHQNIAETTGTYVFTYVAEGISDNYIDTSNIVSSINSVAFASKVKAIPTTYTFTLNKIGDVDQWIVRYEINGIQYEENAVLSQYGIVLNGSELTMGNVIIVPYASNHWYDNHSNPIMLESYGIIVSGKQVPGDSISVSYEKNVWQFQNADVDLRTYGITNLIGGVKVGDNIRISYRKRESGVIKHATPSALYTVGFNAYDYTGNQTIKNYIIDSHGDMQPAPSQNHSDVIFFKCKGGNTYTIYDASENGRIISAYYSEEKPASYSTGLEEIEAETYSVKKYKINEGGYWGPEEVRVIDWENRDQDFIKYYTPIYDGYLCVVVDSVLEDLCCHLSWTTGETDRKYESYWDSSLEIPYQNKYGTVISTYGLAGIDNTYYDEIDFERHLYYKRVREIDYTPSELARVQSLGVPYLSNNSKIYYGIDTIAYELDPQFNNTYKVDDFGTEELLDTDLSCRISCLYNENLKDKLRNEVEVVSNKFDTFARWNREGQYQEEKDFSVREGEEFKYPSLPAMFEVANAIWSMLGLSVDSFDGMQEYNENDYVTYKHGLYKCTKNQEEPQEYWSGQPSEVSSDDLEFSGDSFINSDFVRMCGVGEYTFIFHKTVPAQMDNSYFTVIGPNGEQTMCANSAYMSWDEDMGVGLNQGSDGSKHYAVVCDNFGWTKSYLFKAQ